VKKAQVTYYFAEIYLYFELRTLYYSFLSPLHEYLQNIFEDSIVIDLLMHEKKKSKVMV
jgi:hypothetical protein